MLVYFACTSIAQNYVFYLWPCLWPDQLFSMFQKNGRSPHSTRVMAALETASRRCPIMGLRWRLFPAPLSRHANSSFSRGKSCIAVEQVKAGYTFAPCLTSSLTADCIMHLLRGARLWPASYHESLFVVRYDCFISCVSKQRNAVNVFPLFYAHCCHAGWSTSKAVNMLN